MPPATRIISLVPSQTELLYTLGLDKEVVGITKFCVHPDAWFRTKPRIGGTKDVHPERIDALHPDLIIANKEENDRQQVEALAARYPVWTSDVKTLPDALDMIRSIGTLTGRETQAQALITAIETQFAVLSAFHPGLSAASSTHSGPTAISSLHSRRTAYLIWRNPWMTVGGDTFIHDMLHRCGLTNIFRDQTRYPSLVPETLVKEGCELVLLSSEPYPFREKHQAELQALLPHAEIRLVDGELFSWYGSRLLQAPAYFRQLFL